MEIARSIPGRIISYLPTKSVEKPEEDEDEDDEDEEDDEVVKMVEVDTPDETVSTVLEDPVVVMLN